MSDKLPDPLLQALREYLLMHLGLDFPERLEKDMIGKIGLAAKTFGYENTNSFVEWLLNSELTNLQMGVLAGHLTIGETYFMREKKGFDFLEQIYLPGLILKRYGFNKRLRIWCAGCATGEEAYSLAIVLFQSIPDLKSWNIMIQATDINPLFLEKARKGIYTKWSFRNNLEKFADKYFIKNEKHEFHIIPEIKKMVTFSPLNLIEDRYPSPTNNTNDIDIIFCRNVFIYFSPEGTRTVTDRFYKSLVKGGILVVSPVEMSDMISKKFGKINFAGYTIYQKGIHFEESKPKVPEEVLAPNSASLQFLLEHKKVKIDILNDQSELNRLKKLLPEKKVQESPLLDKQAPEKDYVKAVNLFEKGFFAEAEALLADLMKETAINGKSIFLLQAKTKANLGKLKEAGDLCVKVLSLDRLDPAPYYLQATVLQEQGNDEMAIASLKRAIYLDSDFILAHFLLGTLSMKSGDSLTGKKSFKNAISSLSKLSPDDIIPESDGLTVGRFKEIINTITS